MGRLQTRDCQESLPYHPDLLYHLLTEHRSGQSLVLATSALRRVATEMADHVGIFNSVMAGNEQVDFSSRRLEQTAERFTA